MSGHGVAPVNEASPELRTSLECEPDRNVTEEATPPIHCPCDWQGSPKDFEEHRTKCGGSFLKSEQSTSEKCIISQKATNTMHSSSCTSKDHGKPKVFPICKRVEKTTCLFHQVICYGCHGQMTICSIRRCIMSAKCDKCARSCTIRVRLPNGFSTQQRPSVKPGNAAKLFPPTEPHKQQSSGIDKKVVESRATTSEGHSLGLSLMPKKKCNIQRPCVVLLKIKKAFLLARVLFDILKSKLCEKIACEEYNDPTPFATRFHFQLKYLQYMLGNLHTHNVNAKGSCMHLIQTVSKLKKILSEEKSTETGSLVYLAILRGLKKLMGNFKGQIKELLEDGVMSTWKAPLSISKEQNWRRKKVEGQSRCAWVLEIKGAKEKISKLQQRLMEQGEKMDRIERKSEKLERENEKLKQCMAVLHSQIPTLLEGLDRSVLSPQVEITREIFHQSAIEVYEWLDVGCIIPYLVKYQLICNDDDMYWFTTGSSREKICFLYIKLCRNKHGFQLFYNSLKETQDTHSGHRDIAEKLEETAQRLKVDQSVLDRPVMIKQEMFTQCAKEVYGWLDVDCLIPYLMKYKLITGEDDMHQLTTGPLSQKISFLCTKLFKSKGGFQAFYNCLKETQDINPGHKDIVEKLEETARLVKQAPT